MNSYIWLSLETLKEVEITKEGLVIHHHPDMCPYTTATALEKQTWTDGNSPAMHTQTEHLTLGPVFKKNKKTTHSHSYIVKEQQWIDSWARRAPG